MNEVYTCHDCLKARKMRRKNKKHYETTKGLCPCCGWDEVLFLPSDYSQRKVFTGPVIVLPAERQPRQLREWPEHMRFD